MAEFTIKRRKKIGGIRGFTLIEVLASLVLVALIIPVAMKGISIATILASESKSRLEALELAQIRLSEILLDMDWQNSTMSGTFEDEYARYRWQMNAEDWTETGIKQVEVKVLWESRGYEREVSLTTLVVYE